MTDTTNPFRQRGTLVVRVAGFTFAGCEDENAVVEVRFPFPSMLLPEAFEWEKRSGLKQREFWKSVATGDLVGLQMLLWQALRRQDGECQALGVPWSTVKWDEVPWDEVDLFRVSHEVVGIEDEEAPADDDDLPTTSSEEGSTTG